MSEAKGHPAEANTLESTESWAPASLQQVYQARVPTPDQEEESLARVKQQLMQNALAPASSARASRAWMAWAGTATAGALGVALFLVWPSSLKPLQFEGTLPQQSQRGTRLQYALSSQQQSRVTAQGQWDVTLTKDTQLELRRESARETRMLLRRGQAVIYVRPKQKQRFVVEHEGWQVQVKGTRFAVIRSGSFLRVQVWSGIVDVAKSEQSVALHKGQGVRIDLANANMAKYPVAPLQLQSWKERLDWAIQQSPADLAAFAMDLSWRGDVGIEQRRQALERVVHVLLRHQNIPLLLQLFERFCAIQPNVQGQQNLLFELIKQCRPKTAMQRCVPLSAQYLRQFPAGPTNHFRAAVVFRHAASLSMSPHHRAESLRWLKQYRETYPNDMFKRAACRKIRELLQAPSSAALQTFVSQMGPRSRWFVRHCQFPKQP